MTKVQIEWQLKNDSPSAVELSFKFSLSSTCSPHPDLEDFCPAPVALGMGRWFHVIRTRALPHAPSRHLGDPPPRLLFIVEHDIIPFIHPPSLSLPLGENPELPLHHTGTIFLPLANYFCKILIIYYTLSIFHTNKNQHSI